MLTMPSVDAAMGAGYIAAHRCDVALHLALVGILLSAGPDGLPLYDLAGKLYPDRRRSQNYLSTRRLVCAAGGALPVWQDTVDGVVMVGLDADAYAEVMRGYGVHIRPTWARDDGC